MDGRQDAAGRRGFGLAQQMRLKSVPGTYAIAQLPPDAALPAWFDGPDFVAMARANDELTLICHQDRVPQDVTASRDWACFRSVGPFAFDESGVVSALTKPIADAGIGIFVVCTYDGEHLLCAASDFDRVKTILTDAGHNFDPENHI